MTWDVRHGECASLMAAMPETSVDAIMTDPPYGIGFMGHEWDQPGRFGPVAANGEPAQMQSGKRRRTQPSPASGAGHARERARFGGPTGRDNTTHTERGGAMHAGRYDLSAEANRVFQAWCEEWAREALRVLKPGGHMVVFGGTRTYHRMAAGVEDAGFEIRDQLQWLFGSGFPKSKDLGDGRGTALKPGHEPILLARKPFKGSATANVAEHGTGGLNIDVCRIEGTPDAPGSTPATANGNGQTHGAMTRTAYEVPLGRWPANVVLDEEAAAILDEQTGTLTSGYAEGGLRRRADRLRNVYGGFPGQEEYAIALYGDSGGASRFYYCAKASASERNAGLDQLPEQAKPTWSSGEANPGTFQSPGAADVARNVHPTVKPIDLMRWLCRLITPPGGIVLDPFTGSGTTGCAATLEAFDFIGLEREAEYVEIARARIAHWEPQGWQGDLLGGTAA